jgi:uncharacterized membrane protein YidH (DUF202 family)
LDTVDHPSSASVVHLSSGLTVLLSTSGSAPRWCWSTSTSARLPLRWSTLVVLRWFVAAFFSSRMQLFSKSSNQDDEFADDGVVRLNRMSTDLANERTMLAWTRTSLAVVRTTFSALALKGITGFGTDATSVFVIGSAVLALYSYAHGYFRYKTVKGVIQRKEPPRYFDRSVLPSCTPLALPVLPSCTPLALSLLPLARYSTS